MKLETLIKTTRHRLQTLTRKLAFLAPALIRITLAVVFIQSGWGKLQDLGKVTQFFTELGIPAPGFNAALAAGTEFFGGILILLGLGARLAALPMAFTMVIAIITAKRGDIDGVTSLLGFEEWSYLVMFLVIAIGGPGALSLDALIARRLDRASSDATVPKPLLRPAPVASANG